jgi:C4-type Zn-finger protein
MTERHDEEFMLVCPDCAGELGFADEAHSVPPFTGVPSIACERCGAILVGFAYRVPRDLREGMTPPVG